MTANNTSNDDFLFSDEEALKFIRNYLPQELKDKFSDDEIYYIEDLIYDYCESNGLLEEGDDEDVVDIDEDDLIDYVVRNARKDGVGTYDPEEIAFIVRGELEYGDSINMSD